MQQRDLLKLLSEFPKLLDKMPEFTTKSEFAKFSQLSALSTIEGLEELRDLSKLSGLSKLTHGGIQMGDLFSQYAPVNPEYKSEKLDALLAYEEHYMKLVRNFKAEIADIENMMSQLRQERTDFYGSKLFEIEKTIMDDKILSEEAKQNWIIELRAHVEKSFEISESLISHYVTSNLEEFKSKMRSIIDKV